MNGDARPDAAAAPAGELDDLRRQLEDAAGALRGGGLDNEQAAALVERLAELAGRLGSALEREARGEGEAPGQETLL